MSAAADHSQVQQRILDALEGSIPTVPVPLSYRIGIAFVAVLMVVLPLIYLSIPAFVAWVVFLHLRYDLAIFSHVRGGQATLFAFLIYIAPLVVGVILIFFLIKPFFARPAKEDLKFAIQREDQPLLFAFVERIQEHVGAPQARRIVLDMNVNASASLGGGLSGLLGKQLTLTIGMPLLAGMSLREVAGVLAHEFGHFAQGASMRLTYIVWHINYWFLRVVYQRDAWDVSLAKARQEADFRIAWILWVASGSVWLTRRVLWALMVVGRSASTFLMRRMEFDADTREIHLAGSDAFTSSMRRLRELTVAQQAAQRDLGDSFRNGKLVDDLAELIVEESRSLSPEVKTALLAQLENRPSSRYDTHPPDHERIARAERAGAMGLFRLEEPARALVHDWPALAKAVTTHVYQHNHGLRTEHHQFCTASEIVASTREGQESSTALGRGFRGAFMPGLPLHIFPFDASESDLSPRERLQVARDAFASHEFTMPVTDLRLIGENARNLSETYQAEALLACGVPLSSIPLSNPIAAPQALESVRERYWETRRILHGRLSASLQPAVDRLRCVAAVLASESHSLGEEFESAAADQRDLERAAVILEAIAPRVEQVTWRLRAISMLLQISQTNSELKSAAQSVAVERCVPLASLLRDIRKDATEARYPLPHADESMTLGRFLVPDIPVGSQPRVVTEAAQFLLNRYLPLWESIHARLCVLAERVETACGFPPLPDAAGVSLVEVPEAVDASAVRK